jgi:hypothetical protein
MVVETTSPAHRRERKMGIAVGLAALVPIVSGCSVFGVRLYEQPEVEVFASDGPYEIRLYASTVVVETSAPGEFGESGNAAFRRLFRYIGGENAAREEIAMTAPVLQEPTVSREPASEKIDMTAPVLQERTAEGWRMSFVLPREFTLATAPAPTDPEVRLRETPGRRLATVRFRGSRSAEKCDAQAERLTKWIESRAHRVVGDPVFAAYDPPFTLPFLRRNEVWIEVEPVPEPDPTP